MGLFLAGVVDRFDCPGIPAGVSAPGGTKRFIRRDESRSPHG
jgi:hypothetical protein